MFEIDVLTCPTCGSQRRLIADRARRRRDSFARRLRGRANSVVIMKDGTVYKDTSSRPATPLERSAAQRRKLHSAATKTVNLKRGEESLGTYGYDEILDRLREELDRLIAARVAAIGALRGRGGNRRRDGC